MERKVRSDCVNASNPFHVCADYCAAAGGQKSSSHSKPRVVGGRTSVRDGERINGGGGGGGGERRHVDPTCVNASNPFHQCSDYCKGKTSSSDAKKRTKQVAKPAQNGNISKEVGEGRYVDPTCVNASNPFHQCAEYCGQRSSDLKKQSRGGKTVPNGEISMLEERNIAKERNVDPQYVNASNPSHQCAESLGTKRLIKANTLAPDRKISMLEEGNVGKERNVDPQCSESLGTKRLIKANTLGALIAVERAEGRYEFVESANVSKERVERAEESKERLPLRVDGKVNPSCRNASNPFHVCAEYCSQKSNDIGRVEKGKSVITNGGKGSLKLAVQKRDVDPRCVNAANPFHVCADYCVQRTHEAT